MMLSGCGVAKNLENLGFKLPKLQKIIALFGLAIASLKKQQWPLGSQCWLFVLVLLVPAFVST
jgi:hypothetical protein